MKHSTGRLDYITRLEKEKVDTTNRISQLQAALEVISNRSQQTQIPEVVRDYQEAATPSHPTDTPTQEWATATTRSKRTKKRRARKPETEQRLGSRSPRTADFEHSCEQEVAKTAPVANPTEGAAAYQNPEEISADIGSSKQSEN